MHEGKKSVIPVRPSVPGRKTVQVTSSTKDRDLLCKGARAPVRLSGRGGIHRNILIRVDSNAANTPGYVRHD